MNAYLFPKVDTPIPRGKHVVVLGGEAQWWRHTVGKAVGDGVFDYWTVLAEERPDLERQAEIRRDVPPE